MSLRLFLGYGDSRDAAARSVAAGMPGFAPERTAPAAVGSASA